MICLIRFSSAANPPSLTEIKNLQNRELDEIFESTKTANTPEPDPIPSNLANSVGNSNGRYNRPASGPREVPINHGHALAPEPVPMMPDGFSDLAQQGANVFANGATAFYRGAATVGQAFGIPQGNYQMPFLSQAAQIFGR
ncbi:unnamed protein product [Caenorhabditis angaria]|uniref:Uncharacterized protein n=1 Tax=Caenorhabditis angaria TaxID=860376 RepID=A0A9P1N8U5_9PELO|nr:unnamed protein product [Caenorhabditis angaria]